jgi:hypothetical protein
MMKQPKYKNRGTYPTGVTFLYFQILALVSPLPVAKVPDTGFTATLITNNRSRVSEKSKIIIS